MRSLSSLKLSSILLVVLLTPSFLWCISFKDSYFIVNSGYWIPNDSQEKDWLSAVSIGGGFGIPIKENTAILASASFVQFEYDGPLYAEMIPPDRPYPEPEGSKNSIRTMIELAYTPKNEFGGRISPFGKVGIGLGFEKKSERPEALHRGSISDGFFFTYALGMEIKAFNGISPFIEGRFLLDISESDIPYIPITMGIRF
jgi:hypothetical protein